VKISWSDPTTNGAAITAYKILIRESDNATFSEQTTYCDGTNDALVIANKYCSIPMSILIASPYSLTENYLVVAKVNSANLNGFATSYSPVNTVGAYVEIVPATMSAPTKGSSTSTS
jgi:hypothetical protein